MRALKMMATGIGLFGSAVAVAGPFCLMVTGMPANCRFYDESTCAAAAASQNGGCVPNNPISRAAPVSIGTDHARYCLVNSGDAKCYYYDAQACAKAAQDYGGTCLTRPSKVHE
jgi:hypothetical protein